MTGVTLADVLDRRLLAEIQKRMPLAHRPFHAVGDKLGLSEQDCLARIERMKGAGIFQRVSAVFEPSALGYERSLFALKVPASYRARAIEELLAYPGLTYLCERKDPFSIWLSAWVPPHGSLAQLADRFHHGAQAEETLVLPAQRVYKGTASTAAEPHAWLEAAHEPGGGRRPNAYGNLTQTDLRCIRALQTDLPLLEMPYAVIAESVEMTEEELFTWCRKMEQQGVLSRIAALSPPAPDAVRERLVVWEAPDGIVEASGMHLARLREVVHCVRRPIFPGWPYALFTVIHSDSDSLHETATRMQSLVGEMPFLELPPIHLYRSGRLALCDAELERWWSQSRASS